MSNYGTARFPVYVPRSQRRGRFESVPGGDLLDGRSRREDRQETADLASLARAAPRIPWDVFMRQQFDWQNGEHIACIGPTGQGKTNLVLNLLPQRQFVTVFATKPRDATLNNLTREGYMRMERWRALDPRDHPKRLLWPDAGRLDSVVKQREVFHEAFTRIFREGGWTLFVDEAWYFANTLKLAGDLKLFLLQARSLDISLICATQRPAHVPLEIYDQSTHLFFWRDNDENNLRRLGGISFRSAKVIRQIVSNLERYQVLYLDVRTGFMCRTHAPAPLRLGVTL